MCARASKVLAPQPALVPRTGCGGLQLPGVASSCLECFGLSLMALRRSAPRSPRGRVAARRVASGRHRSDELNLGSEASRVKSHFVSRTSFLTEHARSVTGLVGVAESAFQTTWLPVESARIPPSMGTATLGTRQHMTPSALPMVVAILLALPGMPPLPASRPARQADARQAPTFRSGVQVVAVYATVSDAGGHLLPDLPVDAFQVFDNRQLVQVATFSNEPQPITVALLLDMSASMQAKVLRVREAARSFVSALQPVDRAVVGTFGEEVAISPLLTGDRSTLLRVLDEELWPRGFTPLWRGIDLAMTSLRDEGGRRVVLVLTDGADTDPLSSGPSQASVEHRAVHDSFMLYAIGLEGTGLARGIAGVTTKTGGGHFQLASVAELPETFARVVDELRHQYLLGFVPTMRDGKLHELTVRGTRPGMRVRARTTYQADMER
jgi:Ca-activated chloride channel homolog